jgi:hypothetical protein
VLLATRVLERLQGVNADYMTGKVVKGLVKKEISDASVAMDCRVIVSAISGSLLMFMLDFVIFGRYLLHHCNHLEVPPAPVWC